MIDADTFATSLAKSKVIPFESVNLTLNKNGKSNSNNFSVNWVLSEKLDKDNDFLSEL